LSELATLTQLPLEALTQTLAHVSALCEQKQTDEFGRAFGPEQQLQGPWFAIQVTGALFHTQGGLEVDALGRVLRAADHQPLPNLFAGGGAARGVSGAGDSGYLSGNGLLSAVVMGTLAGRSAAQLTRSEPLR
jgi:fumarate reductase flavoprotein subunit